MSFEEKFQSWTLEQKVEWALGPNICNLSENMRSIIVDLKKENEMLKGELQQSETKCNNLRYALARLRWAHALDMESMIDQLYTERPSSWRFYYKSKVYWYNKWQELKKKLKERK